MSKELPYYRFTVSEWMNGDISLESYELKGLFIDVCAYYWFKDCSVTQAMLHKRFSDAELLLSELVRLEIIKTFKDSDFIEIIFLNEQFNLLSKSRKLRQVAGSKGGKKRSSNAKAMLKQGSSYKDKDNNKDKDKERYIIPPTFEMVKTYCDARKNNIDPQSFIDQNIMKGWVYGKNKTKIVDWQAAVRTWEKFSKKPERLMMP